MTLSRLTGAGTPFDLVEAIGFERAPYASLVSGPWAWVAGANGLTVGCFAWVDPNTGVADNVMSDDRLLGFVLPLANSYNLWERAYLRRCLPFPQMVIRPGVACVIAAAGQFSPKFPNGGQAGERVFADPLTGLPYASGAFLQPTMDNSQITMDDSALTMDQSQYVPTPYTLARSGEPGARIRMSSFIQPFN